MAAWRNPYDGEPYYCADCGLGLSEYLACEDGPCRLESRDIAALRKAAHEAQSDSSATSQPDEVKP